jgi:diphthine methyl ester synthase
MFYLIGLGLSSEKDVSIAGLEAIKGSSRVYLESYTSFLIEAAQGEESQHQDGQRGKNILVREYHQKETSSWSL